MARRKPHWVSVMVFFSPQCTSCVLDVARATGFKRFLKCFLCLPKMSTSLLSRTPFPVLTNLAVLMLCYGNAGWFDVTLCLLASNWNQIYNRNTPKVAFKHFYHFGCDLFRFSLSQTQRGFGFVLETSLVHLIFPPVAYLFSSCSQTESFRFTCPVSWWSDSSFELLSLLFFVCYAFFKPFATGTISCLKRSFYILAHQPFPLHSEGLLSAAFSWRSCWFSRPNLQSTAWRSVKSFVSLWYEHPTPIGKRQRSDVKINQRPLTQ